jgi:alkanesulfonate monooxygenase SsuD/methylene tetrahydromethanopterin reductase-like flavin-dependent oxidoreductase (luciferase family)
MELGIYHEFPVLPGRSQAECFAAGFDIVDASEEYGLDVMWLAELHFDKRRALAASPLVLGTAIAARTERIRIGTSVQVLPLANPLRIAEEAATLDHVSKGRLIFGVGRSGVVKTYEALNIAYSESKDREIECLEIIRRAWREDNFSYKGKFYDIQDVTVVPQPVQQPTPEIRIAAVSVEGVVTLASAWGRPWVRLEHAAPLVSPPSLSASSDPARDLALSAVHPELPGCRGAPVRWTRKTRQLVKVEPCP